MEIWQASTVDMDLEAGWRRLQELGPDLVLVFGSPRAFHQETFPSLLQEAFPTTIRMGCSTAGEIVREGVKEGHVVLTALKLQRPALRAASTPLHGMADSLQAGSRLGEQLRKPLDGLPLRGVMLLGHGVRVNGSALIHGVVEATRNKPHVFGALAGDDGAFERTFTLYGGTVSDTDVVALGFYGDGVELRTGSAGGWMPFGPVRRITRARNNLLHELDGEPALEVYRRYLGDWAKDLPGSGLLFPISLLEDAQHETGLIRTLLGIDEAGGSLILAGDVPENSLARLMHADTGSLLEGASQAARAAMGSGGPADLALLFSCVGRKLVMGGRVDQEVEAVTEVLNAGTIVAGFYSNGEIGPRSARSEPRLHNQTMTVTLLTERV